MLHMLRIVMDSDRNLNNFYQDLLQTLHWWCELHKVMPENWVMATCTI